MNKTSIAALSGAFLMAIAPQAASAQTGWAPGTEITGHAVQVQTGGVTNTVHFDQGGTARIMTPSGSEVQGRWFVENQMLCLQNGAGARECWPYRTAFQTGQAVDLTSSCSVTSRWTPISTQPMMQQQPTYQSSGERG